MNNIDPIKLLIHKNYPDVTFVKMQSFFHSNNYIFCSKKPNVTPSLFVKQYKYKLPSEIKYEFEVMDYFYAKNHEITIRCPKPICFDYKTQTIIMEFVDGKTLKENLLMNSNSMEFHKNVQLISLGLSNFHKLFPQTKFKNTFNSPYLPIINQEEIDFYLSSVAKSQLNQPVFSFLDYTPQNLIIVNSNLYIIDFPERECISTPHLDLARMKFQLYILKEYPQFRFWKSNCLDVDYWFNNIVEYYCSNIGVKFNSYDEQLIEFFLFQYAVYLDKIYRNSNKLRLKFEHLYLKKCLNKLLDLKRRFRKTPILFWCDFIITVGVFASFFQ